MPMVVSDTSTTAAERINRYRKPRNQKQNNPIAETDPNPETVHSTRSKSTISAILLAPFSPTSPTHDHPTPKKKNFTTFRGLGCAAPPQVSVPAVIRTSADWDSKKVKKKKLRSKKNKAANCAVPGVNSNSNSLNTSSALSSSCVTVPDVWCGPGIGLTTDAASVDYVASRRPVTGRGRGDTDKVPSRERSGYTVRRMVIPEDNQFLEPDTALELPRSRVDHFVSRHHRHSRYGIPEGLAEIVMLQNSLMMGGRPDGLDQYRDLRLDVDNMSYEELLELGDKIGHVSTGLREDEIARCVQKTGLPFLIDLRSHKPTEMERKCSVCQEEYEADDEMGTLECGHFYHIHCIREWLQQKNACPICKSAAASHCKL